MTKTPAQARYIKPETICIGDVIRVTHSFSDIKRSITGKVARREHYQHSTAYYTKDGYEIVTVFRVGPKEQYTVTLLEREADATAVTLEGMEI